jgi:hypothetical protein
MAISPTKSRAIQLYERPQDTVYTIEATSQLVNVPRRTILVYCKHRLLSPALETVDRGYYFDRDGIHSDQLRGCTKIAIEAITKIAGNMTRQ